MTRSGEREEESPAFDEFFVEKARFNHTHAPENPFAGASSRQIHRFRAKLASSPLHFPAV